METANLQFSLNSENFKLLENDGYCSIAEIDFLHLGLNRNRCYISEESVKKSLNTFYNKPLLCILDNSIIPSLSVDFKEHAWSEDERKKFIAFGTIPESSVFQLRERENGKTYLSAKVVIWKNYFPIIMDILKRRDGNIKVSIELAVLDGEQDELTGVLDIKKFKLLSCVMLGENIMEGIEGSHLEVLRFSLNDEDVKKANEYFLNFSHKIIDDVIEGDIVMNNSSNNEITDIVFAKEDYGTGKAIKVDKSKEAMSEKAWGSVDKTALRKKVLEAKNYKTLVKDVYALVEEGWEDAPSTKLKYPIMEIIGDKAVYNRYALASALAYARKNNETEVIAKVESLYKKLDIDDEGKGGEKEMEENEVVENKLNEEEVIVNSAEEQETEEIPVVTEEVETPEETVVVNKLDEDNKDIEDIKDDAEAQEDDVKEEEVKNADTNDDIGFECGEVKNADTCDDIGFQCGGEVKNEIEKDDKGEEGLEDDVDSDKDYWKEKANALEIENAEIKEELKKYKRAEEEIAMSAEIDKFSHCMSEEEATELKNSISTSTMAEVKDKINEIVASFALKLKEEKPKEVDYSINTMFEINAMNFSKEEISSLDNIITNSHVEITGK